MSKNLLIVESPAKAKTIEKYLGKDFKVKSSFGHIRDLERGKTGVDIENKFKPKYVVSPEKKKVVKDLKDWVKKVDEVWLATDEDREGEAISWHLCKVLGLDEHSTKRIVFREITKPAILNAITNPRLVDINLVNAQQARRILDRLVGFELSEVLWRKVRNKLSAGRVQSVAVKLVVEREREIQGFESRSYFKVSADFIVTDKSKNTSILKADLNKQFDTEKEATDFLHALVDTSYTIGSIEKKPSKRKPAAPFTTSTLQQEASRKLYFSVKKTMSVAQKLYEQGFISYMRTDSISLSELALQSIASEIESQFGAKYVKTRRYKSKNESAQEAHEAIRPTYINNPVAGSTRDEQRLYELIWKRTIASQMAEAELEKTIVKIDISGRKEEYFQANGEVLLFDGFLKVYREGNDEEEDEDIKGLLPPLEKGQILQAKEITAVERFTKPPARYTEASLVKKLEEQGIGRPSTYAPTISKIMEEDRGYVTRESRPGTERKYVSLSLKGNSIKREESAEITGATTNRLYPSDIGMLVTDFLEKHFEDIMNYNFTAEIEKKFDDIASGGADWNKMIELFYGDFHKDIEETLANADRERGKRELGKDPVSGHTLLVQMTRFGPVVQIGTREEVGEEGKPKFANLKPGQSIETISFEEALELFKLPRTLGEYEGKDVEVNTGRFGPYVKFEDKFISMPRTEDPMEIDLDRAIQLIEEKRKEDAPISAYKGKPVTKGKGRFGPYLKWDGLFINVPKRYDFENLKSAEVEELISAKIEKEANRYIKRWEEEKIAIENGRWGPFIRFGKKNVKIPKVNGEKLTADQLKEWSLEEVKNLIEMELPGSFKKTNKKA